MSCGVAQKDVIGICEPWARPCLIGPDEDHHTECFVNSPTLIIAIVLIFLAVCGARSREISEKRWTVPIEVDLHERCVINISEYIRGCHFHHLMRNTLQR